MVYIDIICKCSRIVRDISYIHKNPRRPEVRVPFPFERGSVHYIQSHNKPFLLFLINLKQQIRQSSQVLHESYLASWNL